MIFSRFDMPALLSAGDHLTSDRSFRQCPIFGEVLTYKCVSPLELTVLLSLNI